MKQHFITIWSILFVSLFGVATVTAQTEGLDTLAIPWGNILYQPGQEKLATSSSEQIGKTIDISREMLDFEPQEKFTVVIADNKSDFLRYAGRQAPDWSAGITDYNSDRIIMKSPKLGKTTSWDYDETLRHEVAHVVIGQNVNPMRLPRWLNEGLAMIIAGQHSIGQMYTLAQHVASDHLISLSGLEQMLHFSPEKASLGYAESYSAVNFILSDLPEGTLAKVLGEMHKSNISWQQSFSEATGLSQFYFEQHWRTHLKDSYKWLTVLSSDSWIFILFAVLAILAYLAIKWRNYRKLQQWKEEEDHIDSGSDWDFEYLPDEDEKWRGDIH